MVKAKNTRTANDTATREETDAVSTVDAVTVDVFQTAARERAASFFREAGAYVASVDARGGKRGSDAAVQRVIADGLAGLTDADGNALGIEPYSHARYSKLSAAYRALAIAGFGTLTSGAFDAMYSLWNVSSSRQTGKERDAFVAGLKRRKSDAARLDAIRARVAAFGGKAPAESAPASTEDTNDAPDVETTPDATPVAHDADSILDSIAELFDAASGLTDADRIRIAAAFTASADALTASVVPADVSSLADAA
jgi:hypothetical protein